MKTICILQAKHSYTWNQLSTTYMYTQNTTFIISLKSNQQVTITDGQQIEELKQYHIQ